MNIKLSQSFLFINSKDYFSKNLIKMRKILTFAIAIISTEFTYAQLLNNDFEQQKKNTFTEWNFKKNDSYDVKIDSKEKHSKRDEGFFNRINALEQKIALYNNDLSHIKDTVDEMNDNLKSLMEKPGKLQDKIIAYIITGIIGIVLGFALKGIFPV